MDAKTRQDVATANRLIVRRCLNRALYEGKRLREVVEQIEAELVEDFAAELRKVEGRK